MPSDFRVPLEPLFEAFGVPATVTRPAPDQTPIDTTGIWERPLVETEITGDFSRREPRKILVLSRAVIPPPMPRGTLVVAPEVLNGPRYTWRVENLDDVEADDWRVVVRKVGTPNV